MTDFNENIENIHTKIYEKLDYFHKSNKIPHLIFHGESGSGKRYIVDKFIQKIYNSDKNRIKQNVMLVNCAHGKGIKFIREELKFFAKTNIHSDINTSFKTIVLINADFLTIDAQSALRRCIELFSHNTRFFIIVENKHKLLNPILSRFCEIYIPEYTENDKIQNLHQYFIQNTIQNDNNSIQWIDAKLKEVNMEEHMEIMDFAITFYNQGLSCFDFMNWVKYTDTISNQNKNEIIICFNTIKSEFRNEKLLLLYLLDYLYLRSNPTLKSVFTI
jgi:DNA polymerase III delta prime subunit|tara:strand:+ start:585 stop:1406 length:822 start_codon:yes stop_codon:yes gene_type:complete